MKKIGNKVFLMIIIFVLIFGLNTVFSIRAQNSIKQAGLQITKQYIPIQTEIFTIQKSMERGQKYLNIISLYDDAELRQAIGLNSANSINISRLLAQVCYYFEAVAQLPKEKRDNVVVSVPSGNFGNLTAGLIAKTLGLPIKRFIASTNANDTVPRYLESGNWAPKATVATLSNAMDVSRPNNWPRVEELFKRNGWNLSDLGSGMLSDGETEETLKAMYAKGYLCEPHGAIAYQVLKDQLKADETGIFLCTAHPAKFKESVERILSFDLPLPEALDKHNKLPLLSDEMDDDFAQLRAYLLK